MNLVSKPTTTRLERRQMLTLRANAGDRVDCLDGSLWITQDGDPRDIVLGAGLSFTLDRAGTAIVEALEDTAVVVRRAAPAATIATAPEFRGLRTGGRPPSFAVSALAAIAASLLLAAQLPAGESPQAPARASSLPAAETAHAGPTWPEPAVSDEVVLLAEPVPTF